MGFTMTDPCAVNKTDSDITLLSIAQEQCLKQLPNSPSWQVLEPNTYSDFGADITRTARNYMDGSGQNKKGAQTGITVTAGFNTDVTANNLFPIMQGALRNPAKVLPATDPATMSVQSIASGVVTFSANPATVFKVGDIVVLSGFQQITANNGAFPVTAVDAENKTLTLTGVSDATPATEFTLVYNVIAKRGGIILSTASGLSNADGFLHLYCTGTPFADTDLFRGGRWVYIVDSANNGFFARISNRNDTDLTFDDWSEVGSFNWQKTPRMFIADMVMNAPTVNGQTRYSYTLERKLGTQAGALYEQAEYVGGAVVSQLSFSVPQNGKVNVDVTFVGCTVDFRDGKTVNTKPLSDGASVTAALAESAMDTANNILYSKISVKDSFTNRANNGNGADALFGFLSEATVTLNSNMTANTALGQFGAFDITAGVMDVAGTVTGYFTNLEAQKAIQNNKSGQLTFIFANSDGAVVLDVPEMDMSGLRLTVTSGSPVTLPITPSGYMNKFGYTVSYQRFSYLPPTAYTL